MEIIFPFERRASSIFGDVWRPIALVGFQSLQDRQIWTTIRMIVDTGADYTLLPRPYSKALGVDLERDCKLFETLGVGGHETVFVYPNIRVRLGGWEADVPVGFLDCDSVPPLLGRHQFLEAISVLFENHTTTFRTKRPKSSWVIKCWPEWF